MIIMHLRYSSDVFSVDAAAGAAKGYKLRYKIYPMQINLARQKIVAP